MGRLLRGRAAPLSYGRGVGGEGSRAKRASGRFPHPAGFARHFLPEGEGKERVIRSQFASELHYLPRAHALVGCENDAQRVDRVFEMVAQIDLAADRFQKQALFALT